MSSDLLWGDQRLGMGLGNVSLEMGLSDKVLERRFGEWVS